MELGNRRDPSAVRAPLLSWLRERLPQADDVLLTAIESPKNGASSETFLVEAEVVEAGARRRERWVVRVQASGYQVYRDPRVERQYRVLDILGRLSDVPVPAVPWFEPDPAVLGAPFFVMQRVEGIVPAESHHSGGLFAEATPDQREAMWLSAIEAMTLIHKVDPAAFIFLDRPEFGPAGADQELAYWDGYRVWSKTPPHPTLDDGRRWLDDNLPLNRASGLAWGDARPANIVFRDNRAVAILDWETVSLGGAESDLGWWLYFDHSTTTGAGRPRLDGIGGRAETIAAWETFMGRRADAIDWHELFATWRFALIVERAVSLTEAMGQKHYVQSGDGNPAIARLKQLIG